MARRLRPKYFKQVLGQPFPLQFLQNSLYSGSFFPVYLFSGSRGCGKTSTARLFARAINCAAYPDFKKDPSILFPCSTCPSCLAALSGAHPDIIEIDAASHTGVDEVRGIQEASHFIPLQGKMRIYIIDEAHMLSKSAFNAFLKLFEEPPATALFILATTEKEKIPPTVQSRALHLAFKLQSLQELETFIKEVAAQEKLSIKESCFALIARHAHGSFRDALNLLERTAHSAYDMQEELLCGELGLVSPSLLKEIALAIILKDTKKAWNLCAQLEQLPLSPLSIIDSLLELFLSMLKLKHGASSPPPNWCPQEVMQEWVNTVTVERLYAMIDLLWHQETLVAQSHKSSALLSYIIVQLAGQIDFHDIEKQVDSLLSRTKKEGGDRLPPLPPRPLINGIKKEETSSQNSPPIISEAKDQSEGDLWKLFLKEAEACGKLPKSLIAFLSSATFASCSQGVVTLTVRSGDQFIAEQVKEAEPLWKPLLEKFLKGGRIEIKRAFSGAPLSSTTPPPQSITSPFSSHSSNPSSLKKSVSMEKVGEQGVLLAELFGGIIEEK